MDVKAVTEFAEKNINSFLQRARKEQNADIARRVRSYAYGVYVLWLDVSLEIVNEEDDYEKRQELVAWREAKMNELDKKVSG